MNFERKLNNALANGFRVREVPMGYAIVSPFLWLDDGPVTFYGRVEGGQIRFEDSGDTLVQIEDAIDLGSEARLQTVRDLAGSHGLIFDEADNAFRSQWVPIDNSDAAIFSFLSFMNRIQDVTMLTREKVEHSFRDDLVAAVQEFFEGRADVQERAAIAPDHGEYVTDVLVTAANGRSAAIYAATSEPKALEALLSAELIQREGMRNVTPFLVYEDLLASSVSKRTRTRTINHDILRLGDWSGGKREIVSKVQTALGSIAA
ncbi:hypothetical protein OSH10_05015 [Kaistia defluvii]|uniref:hypothetical protein n=1 Tax=Kaistia defluvii TaxID=410841 RepID=UPI00224E959A|nr:hypothetical protein [Kaistia defluvii]MCX5517787.1 hypothetical protein [Kaistia defluvii]